MDSIKISVDVNVHLSEKTEGFILDLVKSIMPDVVKAAPAASPAPAKAPQSSGKSFSQ